MAFAVRRILERAHSDRFVMSWIITSRRLGAVGRSATSFVIVMRDFATLVLFGTDGGNPRVRHVSPKLTRSPPAAVCTSPRIDKPIHQSRTTVSAAEVRIYWRRSPLVAHSRPDAHVGSAAPAVASVPFGAKTYRGREVSVFDGRADRCSG